MTATGNLSRNVVAHFVDAFTWPDFDKTYTFRFHKVINEPDFLPHFFTRHVAQGAKRLRQKKEHLVATVSARRLLDPTNLGALQPLLFQTAFWFLSLGYLARGLHDVWPQHDIGVVLWCLSVAAADWQTPERLTRLCTYCADQRRSVGDMGYRVNGDGGTHPAATRMVRRDGASANQAKAPHEEPYIIIERHLYSTASCRLPSHLR